MKIPVKYKAMQKWCHHCGIIFYYIKRIGEYYSYKKFCSSSCKKKYNFLKKLLNNINNRCTYPYANGYKYYGGKGIKNFLTLYDLKTLLNKYDGYKLKNPSIDRIDPNGDYVFSNCRFIEMSENRKWRKK